MRKVSSPDNSLTLLNLFEDFDFPKTIKESSEYNVMYLSKWRKVPFKIGMFIKKQNTCSQSLYKKNKIKHLELSKDNLELEEIKPIEITKLRLTNKRSNFYTIPMKNIVDCGDLKDSKIPGKSHIRIIAVDEDEDSLDSINTPVYKHLDFECDSDLVEEIKKSFSHLIMFCNSPYLQQYKQQSKKITTTKWSRRFYQSKFNAKKLI